MEIKYKLNADHFLDNQLYIASTSKRIVEKRRKSVFIVPIAYLFLGLYCFYSDVLFLGVAFITFAILWYFLYPLYQAKRYYKHYEDFIEENYEDKINKEVVVRIKINFLECSDHIAESKIKISSIQSISKLPNLYLLNFRKASNLIIPRNIENQDSINQFIDRLVTDFQIKLIDESSWKWK